MQSRFRIDPLASALAEGRRDATWGLQCSAHALCREELRIPYKTMQEKLESSLGAEAGGYVYPWEYLHITVAGQAPFTNTQVPIDERPAIEAAWRRVMDGACRQGGHPAWPTGPFPLVYDQLRLDNAAGLFLVSDLTGSITRIRTVLADLAANSPELAPWRGSSCYRAANIVHSTVVRWARPPQPGVTDDMIEGMWQDAVKDWQPVTVMADSLLLVRECVPYMHMDFESEDKSGLHATDILATYDYGK